MEVKYLSVSHKHAGQRIDLFLAGETEELSRTRIQKLIEGGHIVVNGKTVKTNYRLIEDDVIEVTVPDPVSADIVAEKIPLDICYEDEEIIVINKPSGMVVHPAPGNYTGTLVNALLYHCTDLTGIGGTLKTGIVHRLDKDTSGLLAVAKTETAHQSLSLQFFNRTVTRKYIAVCHGVIDHNLGRIDAPLARDRSNRLRMTVTANGKEAITTFKVLKRFSDFTLIEATLITGRTHQIRAHFRYIGYPIVGDPLYGPRKTVTGHGQFLHAETLGFRHPVTGEYLEFKAPLPDYFREFIKREAGDDKRSLSKIYGSDDYKSGMIY